MADQETANKNEKFWRDFLEHPDTFMGLGRQVFRRLPSDPRCQLCAAPFTGVGGSAMRMIGKRQSDGNPSMCNSCQAVLIKNHGGAEVDGAMLFADIRGSTTMAEHISPTAFRALLDRFYTAASSAVVANGGIVDKFVGDELVALFPPLLGERYAGRAIDAARALLKVTGHADPEGPWVPVGAAVHSGRIWFGALAEAGEIIVSAAASAQAGLDRTLERRTLQLKGRAEPVEVVSLRVAAN
ncbi:MAG: adenylate/guanylate cyclase domain-containing protein [Chloroflexota bacterium]